MFFIESISTPDAPSVVFCCAALLGWLAVEVGSCVDLALAISANVGLLSAVAASCEFWLCLVTSEYNIPSRLVGNLGYFSQPL